MSYTEHDVLVNIFHNFLDEPVKSIEKINQGHINSTFLVESNSGKYILQGINKNVFPDPKSIMLNLEYTSQVLAQSSYSLKILTTVKTKSGELLFPFNGDEYRLINYIDDTLSFNRAPSADIVRKAGKAFADFHKSLFGTNTEKIRITIPGFFDFSKRATDYESALVMAPTNRLEQAEQEINMVRKLLPVIHRMETLIKAIPSRAIHGDPKLNNILFEKNTLDPQCIIDLDTIMSGPLFYDFSDMVRSYTNLAEEDEVDIEQVKVSREYLESLIEGYIVAISKEITRPEAASLIEGFSFITFIQAVRFLTDFLQNDRYYSIDYENHNLVRAQNQIKLYEELEMLRPEIEDLMWNYLPR